MALQGAPAPFLPPPLSIGDLISQQRPPKSTVLARKGAPWTDDEHSAFLAGLKVYGRGQWKLISRYYVPSRTPTQVASHAQKHFLRQSGAQKRRSRFSAVEEAVASPQPPVPPLLPPLPLPGLHRAPGMMAPPPPATAPGVPAMPTLFGHSLPPAQHAAVFLQPPPRLVGAPGTVVGGVAMGVPIGVLPPLPSITTASGAELPILPVLPGRINAIAASAAAASAPSAPTPPPAATASYSGSGDSGSERRHSSASPPPEEGRQAQRSRVSAPAMPPLGSAAKPSYAPSGRTQQLLRLLELNEQLAASSAGAAGGADGSAGSTGSPQGRRAAAGSGAAAMDWQPSVERVPSATAALDTLALLAEAEAESDAGNAEPAHSARTPLVSAF